MVDSDTMIDFAKIGGPVYVGRSNGVIARQRLQVDKLDAKEQAIDVYVPDETYTITSSYFLGLFAPSVARFGTEEAFLSHYRFHGTPVHLETIQRHVQRALREHGDLKLTS